MIKMKIEIRERGNDLINRGGVGAVAAGDRTKHTGGNAIQTGGGVRVPGVLSKG